MRLGKKWLVLLVVCLVFLLAGCALNAEPSSPSAEDETAYTLPMLLPMTGMISNLGEDALWAAKYAVDEINKAGGINGIPVNIDLYDSQNNEKQVARSARDISGRNRFFIGPIDSVGTAAEAEVIAETGTPNIAAYSFASLRKDIAPYGISYMSDTAEGELEAVRQWKYLNPDIEKVAVIVNKNENSQMDTVEALRDYLTELNMSVCAVVEMDPADDKGLEAAADALNAKADGYIVLTRSDEYGVIVSELRKRGVSEGRRITASFASNDYDLIRSNREVMEGTYIWNKFDVAYQGTEWQALLGQYREDHNGEDPNTNIVPDIYNAVYAWKQCIEDLGLEPDAEDLKAEKEEITKWFMESPVLHGIQGDYQWSDGNKKGKVYYFQIDENGVPKSLN